MQETFTGIHNKECTTLLLKENYNLLYLSETSLSLTYKIKVIINKNKISTVFYSTMILGDFKINNESYHIAYDTSLFIYKIFVLIIFMACRSHIHAAHIIFINHNQCCYFFFLKPNKFYYSKTRITVFVSTFLLEKLKVLLASQISAFFFPISFRLP